MGADFFDGLGETLTRTAKEFGERAEQIYEVQKIRNKISGEERIVDKIMVDVGNLIYKRYRSGEVLDGELSVLCEEIHQHVLKIKAYKEDAADIKGKKICPSCEKAVDKEVSFCPYCGAPCPEPKAEEIAEEEIKEVYEENFSQEEACCGSEEQEAADGEEQQAEEELPVEAGSEESVEPEEE